MPHRDETHVHFVQVHAERWPVHVATGQGWSGPSRLFLSRAEGPLGLRFDEAPPGGEPGEVILAVAKSWDCTVTFFCEVRSVTPDGRMIVSWPEDIEVERYLTRDHPERHPGQGRRAA